MDLDLECDMLVRHTSYALTLFVFAINGDGFIKEISITLLRKANFIPCHPLTLRLLS